MKKIIIWISIAVVAVAFMIGASSLYKYLGKQVENDIPQLTLPQDSSPSTELESEENEPQESEADTNSEVSDPEASDPDTSVGESEPNESELGESELNESEPGESEPDTSESESDAPETEPEPVEFNAPDFTFYDINGNAVRLSDFAGKPIVLNIWATWCYYCTVEMPDFDEMYKKYPEVQFLMVNATGTNGETVASAKKYIESNGFEFPVFYDLDGAGLNTYGVTAFPTTILITRSGELVYNRAAMLSAAQLEGLIKQLVEIK